MEPKRKTGRTMDLILVLMGVVLLAYTVVVLVGWMATGTEPGVLTTCVFAVCGFECGVMGWIKTTKERLREQAEKERAEAEAKAKDEAEGKR